MEIRLPRKGFAVDKVVNRVGLGGIITRNGAGDAGIRTLSIAGNLSYNLPLGDAKEHILSAGVQVGIFNKSFDQSKMSFDNQYNPDAGYDPSISSGEIFTNTSITRPDVNVGIFWQRGWLNKDIRFKPFAGISLAHINRPNETFIIDNNKMPVKKSFYFGAGFMVSDRAEIRPSAMILRQQDFKETNVGALVNYQLDNKNAVQLGAYNRFNDALIAYAGYQMNLVKVGMSYDINTSSLSTSGKGTNAFELSITYSPRPKRAKEPKEILPTKQLDTDLMETLDYESTSIEVPEELTNDRPVIHPATAEQVTEQPVATKVVEQVAETPVKTVEKPIVIAEQPKQEPAAATPVAVKIEDFDKDGIIDAVDDCPYIKGSKATNGCPDSDNDGVIDMQDDCPMESGTAATKGCPDKTKAQPVNSQQLIRKFDNILFESGKTRLRTDDIFDIIERAIDIMYADKDATVILSGHTDSEGDAFQNMVLSQSRADMVKTYMVKQGIDESRIKTVTYGETMPLEDNTTVEGKQLNRRVEINILKIK
ncbi:MAG: PorP/SprF family type IX secretion system membrane protein [Bacteroidetes bacterium]|nr:PorP/SprF family type IX secretion system membrane protein [Bacteroidota bacterium]